MPGQIEHVFHLVFCIKQATFAARKFKITLYEIHILAFACWSDVHRLFKK
jgi:hypothetical protein